MSLQFVIAHFVTNKRIRTFAKPFFNTGCRTFTTCCCTGSSDGCQMSTKSTSLISFYNFVKFRTDRQLSWQPVICNFFRNYSFPNSIPFTIIVSRKSSLRLPFFMQVILVLILQTYNN